MTQNFRHLYDTEKVNFKHVTGVNPEDNLAAYIAYINTIIADRMLNELEIIKTKLDFVHPIN